MPRKLQFLLLIGLIIGAFSVFWKSPLKSAGSSSLSSEEPMVTDIMMQRPTLPNTKVGMLYTPYNKVALGYDNWRFPYYLHYGIHDFKKKPWKDWPPNGVIMYSEKPWLGTFNIEATPEPNPEAPKLPTDQVLKTHARWLYRMGLDFVIIDSTNHAWTKDGDSDKPMDMIRDPLIKILDTWIQMRKAGEKTPQVSLWIPIPGHQKGDYLVSELVKILKRPEYKDLLFQYQGKPLLHVVASDHPDLLAFGPTNDRYHEPNPKVMFELKKDFTVREMWANEIVGKSDNWSYYQRCIGEKGDEATPYLGKNECNQRVSPSPDLKDKIEQIPVTFSYARDHISNRQSATPRRKGLTFLRQLETVYKNRKDVDIIMLSSFNTWGAVQQEPICLPDHPSGLYKCAHRTGRNLYVTPSLPVNPTNEGLTPGFTDDYDEEYGVAFEPGGVYGDYYIRLVNQALHKLAKGENPVELYDQDVFKTRGDLKLVSSRIEGWACSKGSSNSLMVSLSLDGKEEIKVRADIPLSHTVFSAEAAQIQKTCLSSRNFHGFSVELTADQLRSLRGRTLGGRIILDSEYFADGNLPSLVVD